MRLIPIFAAGALALGSHPAHANALLNQSPSVMFHDSALLPYEDGFFVFSSQGKRLADGSAVYVGHQQTHIIPGTCTVFAVASSQPMSMVAETSQHVIVDKTNSERGGQAVFVRLGCSNVDEDRLVTLEVRVPRYGSPRGDYRIFVEPNAATAPNELRRAAAFNKSAADIGFEPSMRPLGPVKTVSNTATTYKSEGFYNQVEMFTGPANRCYRVVALAPQGTWLRIRVKDDHSDVAASDSDRFGGRIVSTSICTLNEISGSIAIETDNAAAVRYRLFSSPNPHQAQMMAEEKRGKEKAKHLAACKQDCATAYGTCGDEQHRCWDIKTQCLSNCDYQTSE